MTSSPGAGVPRPALAVCIAGMHRSGTSMVTRLLGDCGLYLGEPGDLVGPDSGGEPLYEHRGFVALNEELLATLGAAWDVPPTRLRWLRHGHRLRALEPRASELAARMGANPPWGWKDPRNSLTLPFWQRVLPDAHVVICVRDVVAVAHSVAARDVRSELSTKRLWADYNRAALRAAPRRRTVVTAYEAYFEDPLRELRRVVARLGLEVPDELLARAVAGVDASRRHHRIDYDPTRLPRRVAQVRRRLAAHAGR